MKKCPIVSVLLFNSNFHATYQLVTELEKIELFSNNTKF